MAWIVNNYIVRGIADFILGVGLVVSQAACDPQPAAYKEIPYSNFTIKCEDGISVKGTHLAERPAVRSERGRGAVVMVHGIAISRRHPQLLKMARDIYKEYDVISIDLRGHGESEGEFTGGESEIYDVRAAIGYAGKCGYRNIGLIGFSAGGIASVREEARNPSLKALVLVSVLSSPEMARGDITRLLSTDAVPLQAAGKFFMYLRGARLKVPVRVASSLGHIDKLECPVLFIHGEKDWIIDSGQSRILHKKANEPKGLVILDSFEHAEMLYRDKEQEFHAAAMDWFGKYLK